VITLYIYVKVCAFESKLRSYANFGYHCNGLWNATYTCYILGQNERAFAPPPSPMSFSNLIESIYRNPLVLRMVSSGMLRRVALVRTDVSEELIVSIIRVTRICELGTKLAVTSNRRTLRIGIFSILITLMKEALSSSEM
jgi:hypothetical protein